MAATDDSRLPHSFGQQPVPAGQRNGLAANGGAASQDTPPFPIVLRGYQRNEVDRYIADLKSQLDGALERAASNDIDDMTADPFAAAGEKVASVLRAATVSAESILSEAQAQAGALLADARGEADELVELAHREADETLAWARSLAGRVADEAQAQSSRLLADADKVQQAVGSVASHLALLEPIQATAHDAVQAADALVEVVRRLVTITGPMKATPATTAEASPTTGASTWLSDRSEAPPPPEESAT